MAIKILQKVAWLSKGHSFCIQIQWHICTTKCILSLLVWTNIEFKTAYEKGENDTLKFLMTLGSVIIIG